MQNALFGVRQRTNDTTLGRGEEKEETRGKKRLVFFQLIFSRYFDSEKVIIGVFSPLLRLIQSSVTSQNTWW
jgi:hypothetical protein